ncbi:MAG TPA: hypothetical protein PKC99_04210 [Anaerolineales bacterium]|nr:hypothetical protein [Anaerolineae bacterium]MBL1172487.1 hypothetical protein [Chloroflexota bacterium]MCL4822742.1 hypothetical protein [Anaerolineales bacterium]MDL1925109.1 hypothetical protein [Anaerolineae bacterium AMX1]NOG75972.1 hypothetical protein [Chloroflexota bacterium]
MEQLSNEPIGTNEPAPPPPPPPTQPTPPIPPPDNSSRNGWFSRKEYASPAEKKKDFWIGVVLFFVLNILLVACQWGLGFGLVSVSPNLPSDEISSALGTILSWIMILLPWALNIGLIVYFALTRSQIAVGMLAGFGIALALVVAAGILFMVVCFAAAMLYGL